METGEDRYAEALKTNGELAYMPVGNSMFPMLRGGEDSVVVQRRVGALKKRDVALYKRSDGLYVLHRALRKTPAGYIFRGDNLDASSEPPVPEEAVLAVLTGFYRREKYISARNPLYRLYALVWCSGQGARKAVLWAYRIAVEWKHRCLKKSKSCEK